MFEEVRFLLRIKPFVLIPSVVHVNTFVDFLAYWKGRMG